LRKNAWPGKAALSIGLATALLYTLGCGVGNTPPKPPLNTYLYVGAVSQLTPINPSSSGSITQFKVESDGALTTLNTTTLNNTATGNSLFSTVAVSPGSQYLLASGAYGISEFGIGSDGILGATAIPPTGGTALAFTPDAQFVFAANNADNTLNSYGLSASGVLTPINTVTTGGYPTYVAVDGSGKFAYVANSNDGTISEYTISAGGVLSDNGSISTGGNNPGSLAVSPGGFLYCANDNSGSVSRFSIDGSSGALTLLSNYTMSPRVSLFQVSFDPAGAYAYINTPTALLAQLRVDEITGALTSNGTTTIFGGANSEGVDPSGRFLFTANADGTVSQFIISSTGALIPNGSVSLGVNMIGETLAFAQR